MAFKTISWVFLVLGVIAVASYVLTIALKITGNMP